MQRAGGHPWGSPLGRSQLAVEAPWLHEGGLKRKNSRRTGAATAMAARPWTLLGQAVAGSRMRYGCWKPVRLQCVVWREPQREHGAGVIGRD